MPTKRYCPSPWESAVTSGSCRAGLVMVTVTPGTAADDSSVMRPSMVAVPTVCAPSRAGSSIAASARNASRIETDFIGTLLVVFPLLRFNGECEQHIAGPAAVRAISRIREHHAADH